MQLASDAPTLRVADLQDLAFQALALGDVAGDASQSSRPALRVVCKAASGPEPAHTPVGHRDPEFDLIGALASRRCLEPSPQAFAIVRVDALDEVLLAGVPEAFRPAEEQFHGTGLDQGAGHQVLLPRDGGGRIQRHPQPRLALPQRLLSLFALGDVVDDG